MRNDELMHYGVLGMKWGVRKYQNKNGTLNAKGRRKYYDKNGKLNEEGQKLRLDARGIRLDGKQKAKDIATYSAFNAVMTHQLYNAGRNFIHNKGNKTIAKLTLQNASLTKKRLAATAFVAGIGVINMAEIYPYAKTITRNVMYKNDKDFKKRVDAMADLRDRLK